MRLLILFVSEFAYQPGQRSRPGAATAPSGCRWSDAVLALIHAEPADSKVLPVVVTKLAKNLKWAARKNHTERIILHSFAHLAEHRAPPETAAEIIAQVEQRLLDTGYSAAQTPFGYLLDLQLSAPGREFTRIYKEF
jgi:hypothetical protein